MTAAPTSPPPIDAPLPPANFGQAKLPVIEVNLAATNLYRVHRRSYGPIFYNRRSSSSVTFRFDAPNDEYGVLYASPSFDACLAETIFRDRFRGGDAGVARLIDERDISERSIATLGFGESRPLRLADLTQPLFHYGFDTGVLSMPDWSIPNRWSLAIHDHPLRLDGIYYRSRFANAESVAIFSDRATLVQRDQSTPLLQHPQLASFLDRYDIGIAISGGAHWMA